MITTQCKIIGPDETNWAQSFHNITIHSTWFKIPELIKPVNAFTSLRNQKFLQIPNSFNWNEHSHKLILKSNPHSANNNKKTKSNPIDCILSSSNDAIFEHFVVETAAHSAGLIQPRTPDYILKYLKNEIQIHEMIRLKRVETRAYVVCEWLRDEIEREWWNCHCKKRSSWALSFSLYPVMDSPCTFLLVRKYTVYSDYFSFIFSLIFLLMYLFLLCSHFQQK